MTRLWIAFPALALATGCAAAAGGAPASAAAAASAGAEAMPGPVADHHVHLLSPAAAALGSPPPLPEATLPEPLAAVVRARNARRADQKALANLYTADALYYRGGTRGWAQGRAAAAGWVKWGITDQPYRIVPVAYNMDGASARVAGYVLYGPDIRFGTSLLSLAKGADGRWRIAAETYVFDMPEAEKPKTAADAVAQLDAVGTRIGAVVSNAYYFDAVRPEPVADPYPKIQADNDWLAAQVAQFPGRLVAFCSVGRPTAPYALPELHRCASSGRFKGLKLHFNAAQLDLHDSGEVAKVGALMAAANRYRMPILVHVRPGNIYGREEAEIFLRRLVAAAPDVPVQIAHLWGGESYSPAALKVYADAVSSGDPAARNLYFDVSAVLFQPREPKEMEEIAAAIRRIGLDRILWGSDAPPAESWEGFRRNVPLTQAEFRRIAANVAPYLQ